ncbi:unnamed protein product, partial [Ectocarpus sp. 12 AP-2014]
LQNTASLSPRRFLRYPLEVLRVHSCDLALVREVLHRPPKGHQGIHPITRLPIVHESSQNLQLPQILRDTGGGDGPAGIGFELELEEQQDKIVNAKSISCRLEHG